MKRLSTLLFSFCSFCLLLASCQEPHSNESCDTADGQAYSFSLLINDKATGQPYYKVYPAANPKDLKVTEIKRGQTVDLEPYPVKHSIHGYFFSGFDLLWVPQITYLIQMGNGPIDTLNVEQLITPSDNPCPGYRNYQTTFRYQGTIVKRAASSVPLLIEVPISK